MIEFNDISKNYRVGDQQVQALKKVTFSLKKQCLTIILGPSGSGKSTLLNILGGMDRPTAGQVLFDQQDVAQLNDRQLTNYRRKVVGFVFQFYNLIPSLTALENVAIAAQLNNNAATAENFLAQVGLKKRLSSFPSQMSGGEMQRVAIARALAKKPKLLLCDEPTGALDSQTSSKVMAILQHAARTSETAVVVVTHDPEFAQYGDQIIRLKDGQLADITENTHPKILGGDLD